MAQTPLTSEATSTPDAATSPGRMQRRGFRLISLWTLLSRILGMTRDIAMAAVFGAGPAMDAFALAFRIPNLVRRLLGEGAQTAAFLPVFARVRLEHGDDSARRFASATFLNLALLLFTLVFFSEVGLGLALWWGAWSPESRLLIELLMVLSPYVLFICLAAQQSAVLHSLRIFGWPAVLPVLLNVVWLISLPVVLLLADEARTRMLWLSAAIVFGGTIQLATSSVILKRAGWPTRVRFTRDDRDRVRAVFAAMLPIFAGVTVTQINTIADTLLAWLLAPGISGQRIAPTWLGWLPSLSNGTAAALYFGQRMYQFPLGVFGVALGTVLFPRLAELACQPSRDPFSRVCFEGLRAALTIGASAGVGLMLLATPITRLLFEHGEFTADDTRLTAGMIVAYGSSVPAFVALLVIQRIYFALDDRTTPVRHGLWATLVNLVLDVVLIVPAGPAGLAWATSLAAWLQVAVALCGLRRHAVDPGWQALLIAAMKVLLALAVMCPVVALTKLDAGSALGGHLLAVLVPTAAGAASYLAFARLLGLKWSIDS